MTPNLLRGAESIFRTRKIYFTVVFFALVMLASFFMGPVSKTNAALWNNCTGGCQGANYCSGYTLYGYTPDDTNCTGPCLSYVVQYNSPTCGWNNCVGVTCNAYCSGSTAYYSGYCSNGVCYYSTDNCANGFCSGMTPYPGSYCSGGVL